jgi:hypothetical protein
MCKKNLIKNYEMKYPHSIDTIKKILEKREYLPEISKLAIKVTMASQ